MHIFSVNVLVDAALGLQIFVLNEIFNAWFTNGAKIFNQYDLIFESIFYNTMVIFH